jgi:hypothetical protein
LYYSMKCSYGLNEFFYKRKFQKHNHDAQGAFVVAAKNQALLDLANVGVVITSNKLETTSISQDDGDPGDKYTTV